MSARLDGDLDARRQGRFDRHVAGCPRCARVFDALRRTLGWLRETAEEPLCVARSVAAEVLARIDKATGSDADGAR